MRIVNQSNQWIKLSTGLLLMVFVLGCQKKEDLQLKKIGEQIFETEFIPSSKYSGYVVDSNTGVEYIYLSNGTTDRKVSFFTLDGQLHKTIDYKTATQGHPLEDISIWSLDTILALSQRTGFVFAINDSGKCIKQVNLKSFFADTLFPAIWMSTSGDDDFLFGNTLYLYRGMDIPIDTTKPYLDHLIKFYNSRRDQPYLIKVEDFFSETPNLTFLVDSFYANFIPKNHFFPDIPDYDFYNEMIHILSFQIDCLFVYDLNGKHLKTIYLDYKNKVDQSLKLYELTENYEATMATYGKWSTTNANYVSNLFYDINRQRYYVVAYHPYDGPDEESWYKRHWSMLVYDKNFVYLDEIIVKNPKTRILFSFLTTKGWYTRKNKKYIENYDPHKTYFDIYTIE